MKTRCLAAWLVLAGMVAAQTSEKASKASLVLLGDVYSGESYVSTESRVRPTPQSLQTSFRKLRRLLTDADHRLANLETAIPDPQRRPVSKDKPWVHRAGDPLLDLLVSHDITHVSLANNHSIDYGRKGLEDTIRELRDRQIRFTGAGNNANAAWKPLRLSVKTGKLTRPLLVIAGFEDRASYQTAYNAYATDKTAGVNRWTVERAAEQIRTLRKNYPDGVIIAYPHWGTNYAWRSPEQKQMAFAIIDAGADLVVGHGAHTIQEVRYYKGRLIVYSLGNFFFMSPGRYAKQKSLPFGLVARLQLDRKTPCLRLYPIATDNRKVAYQPRPVTEGEMATIVNVFTDRCRPAINKGRFSRDDRGHYLQLPIRLKN